MDKTIWKVKSETEAEMIIIPEQPINYINVTGWFGVEEDNNERD